MITIGLLTEEQVNEIIFIQKMVAVANRSRHLGMIAHDRR